MLKDHEPTASSEDLFYIEAQKTALKVARRILGNREDAEDIAQETAIKAYLAAKKGKLNTEDGQAWVNKAARHTSIDVIRRRKIRQKYGFIQENTVVDPPSDSPSDDPLDLVVRGEAGSYVRKALEGVDSIFQDAIEATYMDDLTHSEAALLLGIPEGTLKTRVRLGQKHVKQELRKIHYP